MAIAKITNEELKQELANGMTNKSIAEKYGMNIRNVELRRSKLAKYGEGHGNEGIKKLVPDGYMVKGTSTMIDAEGNEKIRWVKTSVDVERQEELLHEMIKAIKEELPVFDKIDFSGSHTDESLLNLYTITDHHIGMLACAEEGGDNYDTKIAEKLAVDWFNAAVSMSPNSESCIINILGDAMHHDGMKAVTPMSGHILSADTRLFKMVRTSIKVIKTAVNLCLKKHKKVKLMICEGNHDLGSSLWLREMFNEVYSENDRVEVNTEVSPYYAYDFGDCMIAMHHGHCANINKMETAVIGKYREMFGKSKFSYIHCGHLHHRAVKETSLMIIEQHQTLAAKDEYSSKGGYYSGRSANVITYHKNYGEVSRVTVPIEMLRDLNPESKY
ncbi:MAG: winged helix-turn-helix domain-containing protein [Bacteroidales bacterium]|nr:winged helix-turn-helix domain-containing protein [Bacteroidales bacterium]